MSNEKILDDIYDMLDQHGFDTEVIGGGDAIKFKPFLDTITKLKNLDKESGKDLPCSKSERIGQLEKELAELQEKYLSQRLYRDEDFNELMIKDKTIETKDKIIRDQWRIIRQLVMRTKIHYDDIE